MIVQIKDFKLSQSENGGFDLIRIVKARKLGEGNIQNPLGEEYIKEVTHGYNMSIERCVEAIIHSIQCENKDVVDLKGFLKSYKELKNEILNILNG